MSNYDYEYSQAGQKSGSVLPWVLLTFVTVGAGVGMYFFNLQKDQAMAAVDHMKSDSETLKKALSNTKQQLADMEKQVNDLKSERDGFETMKNDANRKVDELSQQLALAKAVPDKPGKGGKGLRGGGRIKVVKGHRH